MVQLMLPGSNAFYYGDELGMRNLPNDTKVSTVSSYGRDLIDNHLSDRQGDYGRYGR